MDTKIKEANIKVKDVAEMINNIAPIELQEKWDNSGMMIGFETAPVNRIMTCLEITADVVDEAIDLGVDMIVTHHPLIFDSLRRICDGDNRGKMLMKLISNEISVYSSHTPFDKVKGGNNDILMKRLELVSARNLSGDYVEPPNKMIENLTIADIGRVGMFKKPLSYIEVIDTVAGKLDISLRQMSVVGTLDSEISTVGVCSGAGAEFMQMAKESGCQLFITGDVKYHQAQEAKELGICLIDAGHYSTEKFFAEAMREKLEKKLDGKAEIMVSEINIDPFEIV